MKKQFTLILFFTTLLSLLISTIIVALLISKRQENSNSHHNCDMSGIAFGIAWFTIIFMALGSNTIYLNCYKKVRENPVYAALSFFLIPTTIAIIIVFSLGDVNTEWRLYLGMTLPYLIILSFHYFRFTRKQRKAKE